MLGMTATAAKFQRKSLLPPEGEAEASVSGLSPNYFQHVVKRLERRVLDAFLFAVFA